MARLLVWLLVAAALLSAQTADTDEFRVYTEAPRLFLRPQRLKLLKRERERQSLRWQQFDLLVSGRVPMPEPGFAFSLYSAVTGKEDYCRQAERGAGSDVRQMALVVDWCESKTLVKPLQAAADRLATRSDIPSVRSRALAAIVLADSDPAWSERNLRDIIVRWWRGQMVPSLRGGAPVARGDLLALFELLHAVRDNLLMDLRDPVQGFFRDMPAELLIAYYPASYPGAENEWRIPYYVEDGEPDLKVAALSRAAELSLVAFDNNLVEAQSLQSWLLNDKFLMKGAFGIVYEFLWANPYQPGITYHFLPNVLHDRRNGRLFVRSSWEDDATFFCYDKGKGQIFEAGKRADVNVMVQQKPIRIGSATIVVASKPVEFDIGFTADMQLETGEKRPEEAWFLVGLKPNSRYDVEGDDEEMFEVKSDAGGIALLTYPRARKMKVRVHEAGQLPTVKPVSRD